MKGTASIAAVVVLAVVAAVVWFNGMSTAQAWQAAYIDTQQALENTKAELQGVKTSLDSVNKNVVLMESQNKDLNATVADTNRKLSASEQDKSKLQSQVGDLQKKLQDTQDKIKLFEDTLGVKVSAGVRPPYVTYSLTGPTTPINLVNNPTAANVSYSELKKFLYADTTDEVLYDPDRYVCGNYAQDLHNNAEKAGIRTAFVAIHYQDDSLPHALNAFKTTDQGLVYIDDTGYSKKLPPHADKKATIEKGKPLYEDFIWIFYYTTPDQDLLIRSTEIYW